MPSPRPLPALALLALLAAGCSDPGDAAAPGKPPAATPAANPSVPRFTDVTAASGVDFTSLPRPEIIGYGQGVAVADFDGDGDLDLFLAQDRGPCALYWNEGGMRFREGAAAAGVQVSATGAHAKAAAAFDFDRDGRPDLFVGTAEEGGRLFRNRGDGTFEDVTAKAGLDAGRGVTTSGVPGDFDGDGWADLFEVKAPPVLWDGVNAPTGEPAPDRLWWNNRDGTFTDVAPRLGVADPLAGWAAEWFDLDGDGDRDLLLANDHFFYPMKKVRDRAYMNAGAAGGFAFTDRAAEQGLDENHSGMGFTVGDLDGDGTFDIFTPDYGPDELRLGGDPLPRRDRAAELGIADDDSGSMLPAITWGALILDLDRDGWNDLLVFRGSLAAEDPGGAGAARQAPRLWLSRPAREPRPGAPGNGRIFVESSREAGLADLRCPGARAAVPCDLDGDGDLDLVVSMRFGRARILRNDTPRRGPWFGVRLRGTKSLIEGTGAVLRLDAGPRPVLQYCSPGGQSGASFPPEWILAPGPGAAGKPKLTVRWPSGRVQEVEPAADAWTLVEEPE